jgi:hypothetical protein
MEEKDRWDEIIRMKLTSIEVNPEPEDWETIAGRLPGKKRVAMPYAWRYAAAVAALFALLAGGYYLFFYPGQTSPSIAEIPVKDAEKSETESVVNNFLSDTGTAMPPTVTPSRTGRTAKHFQPAAHHATEVQAEEYASRKEERNAPPAKETDNANRAEQSPKDDVFAGDGLLIADATPLKQRKRWGIGVGGGSYSVGSAGAGGFDSRGNALSMFNSELGNFITLRRVREQNDTKQNMSHQRPLSFGLGFGYALDNRWTLYSGLSYTMLASKWDVLAINNGKAKQQLHFAGIPLGVNYRIAEWNRFRFYASTGGTAEWNIGGRIKTKYYNSTGLFIDAKTESVRTNGTQFSVNGRVGVNYPLLRFISAYVEGGGDYYFRNESSIETIRSDKPFQLSLQAGIRFGF